MQKNMIKAEELLDLLNEAADMILDMDYSRWDKANTMTSFNDWYSGSDEETLHNRLKQAAIELEMKDQL